MCSKSVDISILITQYNKPELTVQCVTSLLPYIPQQYIVEVLIVDNGSTPGTIDQVENALGKSVSILRQPTNISFSRICNLGAQASSGRHIVFLNNDTVTFSDWISPMLSAFKANPAIGLVGSRLLYPDMTIQHAGIVFATEGIFPLHPVHVYRGMAHDDPNVLISRPYPAVTGAAFMIERELFDAIGMFDERYVFSAEDIDLCLKVIEAGRVVWYEANSTLIHLESKTRAEEPGNTTRDEWNLELLNEKWLNRRLFQMSFELPGTSGHHKTPLLFVVHCRRNIRSLYRTSKMIIGNMKSGDRLLLVDCDADAAAKQYAVHLTKHNNFVVSTAQGEFEGLLRDDGPVSSIAGYDGFKIVDWRGLDDFSLLIETFRKDEKGSPVSVISLF